MGGVIGWGNWLTPVLENTEEDFYVVPGHIAARGASIAFIVINTDLDGSLSGAAGNGNFRVGVFENGWFPQYTDVEHDLQSNIGGVLLRDFQGVAGNGVLISGVEPYYGDQVSIHVRNTDVVDRRFRIIWRILEGYFPSDVSQSVNLAGLP